MGFYEEISKYYDYIFPTGKEQVEFIKHASGKPPKNLLDIACGTGEYSLELAKLGFDMTANDIDEAMINALKTKVLDKSYNIKCIKADMLSLEDMLTTKYDLAFCIGNSIVHLSSLKEIQRFLTSIKSILGDDGKFIIQIINFDRVIFKHIQSLPTIQNDEIGLKFQRFYKLDTKNGKILFKTVLEVNGNVMENEISLFPLLSEDLVSMLQNSGFKTIKLYGDFNKAEFEKDTSYMLVVLAY